MISNWLKNLERAAIRSARARGDARFQRVLGERDATIQRLNDQAAEFGEKVKTLQSMNRIQQAEIDELSAVVARNLERVKAETRELAGARVGPMREGNDEVRRDD